MNRIKLNLTSKPKKVAKICGERIEISTVISTMSKMEILDVCTQQQNEEKQIYNSLPIVKAIFDIAVLGLQTNIDIPEFKETRNGDTHDINIDINSECVEYYENSGVFATVFNSIENYNETWNMVLNALDMLNVNKSLGLIASSIPSDTKLNSTIEFVSKFAKENPDFVKGIVKEKMIDRAMEVAKEEVAEKKLEHKAETLVKKEFENAVAEKKKLLAKKK